MWKTIFVNLFSFTILTVSANAELWWWSGTKDNPSYFSKAGITVSPTTDLNPYSSYATPDGENYFVLDQNITVQMFRSLWQSSNQHISMTDGSVLTIDTAPNGKDGYFSTIALRGIESFGQNSMIFESGTVNIVNSARDTYNMSADIRLNENSSGANNKILTFESGTTLNSELSLFFFGANNSEYPERSVVNLNGALNTSVSTDGVVKYNSITLKGDDNNSIIVNFGETATANIGKTNIEKNSVLNIAKGANVSVNTKNSGIASEKPNIQVDTNAVLNVNGNLKISATASTHAINVNGTVNVGKDASVYIKDGGYRNVQVFSGGVFDISSTGKDSVYVDDGFRLIGGKLVLRSEEAIASTVIWLYPSSASTIDLYAAAHAKAFTFTDGSKLTVNFNEGGSLWLDEFTVMRGDDGWAHNLDENAMLTLVNYSNYLLHVNSFRAEDDLSRIFAEGFEEGSFRWEADTVNGGYWLVGTAVPEPAAVASVLGAFAFALAAYRRLK